MNPRPVAWFRPGARLLVAGQAPGARVHESGRPFTDRSGDRLRDWMGVTEAEFYDLSRVAVVPMAFCFPGYDVKGDRILPPPPVCAATWRARVMARAGNGLRLDPSCRRVRRSAGTWGLARPVTAAVADWRGPAALGVFPLPHPSWRNTGWLKRHPWFEAELLPVLARPGAGGSGGDMSRIVDLNGVGSVGKSTLAHALQARSRVPLLHVPMDVFLEMLPAYLQDDPEGISYLRSPAGGRGSGANGRCSASGPGSSSAAKALAEPRCDLILDTVMDRAAALACRRCVFGLSRPFSNGLVAQLAVLEAREAGIGATARSVWRGSSSAGCMSRSMTI